MAKNIAKRKLKDSYYAKNKKQNEYLVKELTMDMFEDENINGLYKRNGARKSNNNFKKAIDIFSKLKNDNPREEGLMERIKRKFVIKISIQSFTMIAIMVFCLCVKYMNLRIVKNSEICQNLIKEYNKSYSKEEIIASVTNAWDKIYLFIDPIIPDNLSQKTIAVFSNMFKKNQTGSLANEVDVYNEKEIKIYEESKVETISLKELPESDDENVNKIRASGIEFVKPTTGVITSSFGEREEIFANTETYHYGTDIANVVGTPIYSSIDGVVTVCSFNNETGNYIELQNGSITTRYCHLSVFFVDKNEIVKKGQLIAEMGDTGLVTGPHLHFEIMYDRKRVDAQEILEL